MRITYVTDSYAPIFNGLTYVVQNLAETMVASGHEVEVVTIDSSFKLPKEERINGVLVRRLLGFRPGGSYHFPSPEIVREISKRDDILHVHNFHSVLPYVCSIARERSFSPKDKFVVTPHYHRPGIHFHSKIAWLPYKRLLQGSMRNFDLVHCVSEFESQAVRKDFGVAPVLVSNGVAPDVYDLKPMSSQNRDGERLKVLCVGKLEKYKRVDMLIEAVSIAQKKSDKEIEINLVGQGPELGTLLALARSMRVNLNYRGSLPRHELLNLYCNSDCLVSCSQYEAYSIVTAEALAIGIPAIIVLPWGVNWKDYPKAAVVDPTPESIARSILQSKVLVEREQRRVPTWPEIGKRMLSDVYCS